MKGDNHVNVWGVWGGGIRGRFSIVRGPKEPLTELDELEILMHFHPVHFWGDFGISSTL